MTYPNIAQPIGGQPISVSQYGEPMRLAVQDMDRRLTALENGEGQSFYNILSQNPLVSTAGTDAVISSGAFEFRQGYAYEVTWFFRFIVNGTGTNCRGALARFRRASVSGTLIHSSGYTDADSVGIDKMQSGSFVLKRTGADTTQTLVMCAQFSAVATGGTVTSMATSTGTTTPPVNIAPSRFTIKRIGLAVNHADALEVPTS